MFGRFYKAQDIVLDQKYSNLPTKVLKCLAGWSAERGSRHLTLHSCHLAKRGEPN